MFRFINALLLCSLGLGSLSLFAQSKSSIKASHPRICGFEGKPSLTQNGKNLTSRFDQIVLRESVFIDVDANSKLCLEIRPELKVHLFSGSQFHIPAIAWDNGAVEALELVAGKVLIDNASSAPIRLQSDLFRENLPLGRFVFEMNAEKPEFRVSVLAGELNFRGLENEVSSSVGSGETQAFLGQQADGRIQYDLLLAGKKVARGQLGAKTKLPEADQKKLLSFFALKGKSKKELEAERVAAAKKAELIKNSLCLKPPGKFNQCLYRCEGNAKGKKECDLSQPKTRCVRLRCLANGEWGDLYVYAETSAPCTATDQIKSCDY